MPLGQGIGELWGAVRDRIEVSGHGPTWEVTAGSFDAALAFARERFDDPVVLARKDRTRWWPRVAITVTTDKSMAVSAPLLEDIAEPGIPEQRKPSGIGRGRSRRREDVMPLELEAIFAHQEQLRIAREGSLEEAGGLVGTRPQASDGAATQAVPTRWKPIRS